MAVYKDKFQKTTNRNLLKHKEFIFPLRNPKIVVFDNMKERNKRDYDHDALMRSSSGIPRKRFVCVDCGFARKKIHQIEKHQVTKHRFITKNGKRIRIR